MTRIRYGFLVLLLAQTALFGQVAVRGKKIYTMTGPVLEDGIVLLSEGRIEAVGPSAEISVPSGYQVFEAEFVTPGLIDAHSVVGLSGILNQDHDQDQLEESAPIQPHLRAIDAYNPREPLVDWVRSFGVTTLHTGHGPGALISGQTMIVKTAGATVDEAMVESWTMVAATFGPDAVQRGSSPGTRSKAVAMLRGKLLEAQAYAEKRESAEEGKEPARDLAKEALVAVLEKKVPLLVTVQRANDILTALRIAEEFGIKLVLDGVAEAHLVLDQIRESGFPVLVHPTMSRAYGERENLSMATAGKLREAGIPFAFQSGFEGYVPKTRVLLFEAAMAVAYGLSFEDALAACTVESARILGIDDRVGTIEPGKDGDVVLFSGDPFEYTSRVTAVFINGEKVADGDDEWR